MTCKGIEIDLVVHQQAACPVDYHDVQTGQLIAMGAKALSDQALEAVTIHCASRLLFRNGQTQPPMIQAVGSGKEQKVAVSRPPIVTKNPTVVVGLKETESAGKGPFRYGQGVLSRPPGGHAPWRDGH